MNNHYRTTLDLDKLKAIGLVSQDFVPEGTNRGLPTQFKHYSDEHLTPEMAQDLCLHCGINQTKDTLTLELKVGTIIRLDSVDPKAPQQTIFLEFHPNYFSIYARGGELAQKQTALLNCTVFTIPLTPPVWRSIKLTATDMANIGLVPTGEQYDSTKHRVGDISICDKIETMTHNTIVTERSYDPTKDETTITVLDNTILRLMSIIDVAAFIHVGGDGWMHVAPHGNVDPTVLPIQTV